MYLSGRFDGMDLNTMCWLSSRACKMFIAIYMSLLRKFLCTNDWRKGLGGFFCLIEAPEINLFIQSRYTFFLPLTQLWKLRKLQMWAEDNHLPAMKNTLQPVVQTFDPQNNMNGEPKEPQK